MAELVDVEAKKLKANALKDQGNVLLSHGKYTFAAEKYTEAIELYPTAIFYSNRAQALLKIEAYGGAIQDANEALALDPNYIKAYYRRGSANYALGKLKLALKDFKTVVSIAPKDPDALKKLKACEKAVREEAFMKAILTDGVVEKPVDIDSIVVEDSYTGPRLPIDPITNLPTVTLDFTLQLQNHFKNQKLLHKKYVMQLLTIGTKYLRSLPSLLNVGLPRSASDPSEIAGTVTVCGDTHGQFYDLCNIFEIGGYPSLTNAYLFNGDFVDRGSFSVENILFLLSLKLALPDTFHLLRGNHETKNMNSIYGFNGEVQHKYPGDVILSMFSKLFQSLPLSAVIENKVFVVHGGISANEYGLSIEQIRSVDRFREPSESGLMSDLLWADPQPQLGRSPSKRGLGFSFGPDYTDAFLAKNDLKLIIRSHEVKDEGYEIDHNGKCITVFSAPNYCDQMGNKGAFIRFTDFDMNPNFTKFNSVPHPNVPPLHYAGSVFSL